VRRYRPDARRWLVLSLLAAVGALAAWAAAPPEGRPAALDDLALRTVVETGSREGDALRAWLVAGAPADVVRGAETYDLNCTVCHGDTGLGYEEARLAFPADHRTCTRCHRPGNAREMSFETMMERQHDLFDVGRAPALRGPGALRAFPTDAALLAYTRATMPRYQPGRLDDGDYTDLVAFMRWIAADVTTPAAR
jgi:hypothetical protein